MKKISAWEPTVFLLTALFAALPLSRVGNAQTTLPLRDSVLAKMEFVDQHFRQRWPTSACNSCLSAGHAGNIWTRGAYFEGHMALYRMNLDTALYNYAVTWGSFFNWAFNGGNGGSNANGECAGQAYAELYQADTTQKIRLQNDTAYVNAMKKGSTVNYWWWVDAIQMAMPVFAKVGALRNDTAAFSTMYSLFEWPKKTMHYWDTTAHLWFRDSTFLPPKFYGPHGLPCYWSRGNGWAIGALCRVLDYLPLTDSHRAEYVQVIQQQAAALKAIQRSDGFWNVDLGDPNDYPGPEESGTGFFVYAMAWGINHGILDTATYLPVVAKGWNAMVDSCIHPMTDTIVLGYVQGSGDEPSSSQPVGYNVQPNFDDYGVGIFLLAGSETYKLAPIMPGAVTLSQPSNGAVNQPVSLTLSWNSVANASSYTLQVSTVSAMNTTVFSQSGITATQQAVGGLSVGKSCFWHVNAANSGGTGIWSGVWSFSTLPVLTIPLTAGWNIISLNVEPADSSTAAIFGDSLTHALYNRPKGSILVKNLAGHTYWPFLGIDGLGYVHTGQGYQMHSDSTDTMLVQGVPYTDSITPLTLLAGWNLIAYLPQTALSVATAMSGAAGNIVIMKNCFGDAYWPDYGINGIGSLQPGQGYFLYMKNACTFSYPSGLSKLQSVAAPAPLPAPRHFVVRLNTGSNATILARTVTAGAMPVADGCEIGAFDGRDNLVGAGTVAHGSAAFAIWGGDPLSAHGPGCGKSEGVNFRLWDGKRESPVSFAGDNGEVHYAENGLFAGAMTAAALQQVPRCALSAVVPNPFRSSVRISFDVAVAPGEADHAVEIQVFDLKGNLVAALAKGNYPSGHHAMTWDGETGGGMLGQKVYILRMRAKGFEQRVKIYRVR
jgi:rhamnogalacturonyl hydrolase YesR